MNMHRTSRLGWIRSSKEASTHAPEEVTDPAQAGSAASGRATRIMPSRRPADRTLRAPTRHRAKRGGLLLLATATLLLIPALAYADVPVATISGPVSVAEGQTGGAVYTVTLEGGTGSEDIVFDYTITGTVSEADYTDDATVDGKLTLAESGGQTPTTGTITIQIPDDGIDEVAETLIVTLTKVTTAKGMVAIGSPNSVTTTILPANTETVSFANTAVSAAENAADGVQFTVNLSADIDEDVEVRYHVMPGTATRSDYESASGTFTITDMSAEFSVIPVDDMLAEGEEISAGTFVETFTVRLSLVYPPDDVALGMATARGTITDNDSVTAMVTASETTVVEGSVATFMVELGGRAGSEDVVVTYNTDATTADTSAADSDDYDAPDGTLIIPAGEMTGTIDVRTHRDSLLEGFETLRVTLTSADSDLGNVDLADRNITTTTEVADPDGTILVSVEDTTTTEGDPAEFKVTLFGGTVSEELTVTYEVAPSGDNPATDGNDYDSMQTSIMIDAEMTTGTITVDTVQDTTDPEAEEPETFTVRLTEVTVQDQDVQARVKLGTTEAVGTIRDDDPLTVTVTGREQVPEGSSATYTVALEGGTGSADIEVDYTVSGTATLGTDYTHTGGTLTFVAAQNESTKEIVIETVADQKLGEILEVTLTRVRTTAGSVDAWDAPGGADDTRR